MSKQYLLPCPCGNEIVVDTTQAGETVACTCGQQLVVPTLRGIQNLQPASNAAPASHAAPVAASQATGCLFAVCLVLLVVSIITGLVAYRMRSKIDGSFDEDQFLAVGDEMIDKMGVDESLVHWKALVDIGLQKEAPPFYVVNQQIRARWLWVILLCASVGAISLVICSVLVVQALRRRT